MPQKNILLTNRHLQDLNPLISGCEICDPGHSFGPAVRPYTLIHYIIKGTGVFYTDGRAIPVKAGQAFLILPGKLTTYEADIQDPWHYIWIGFDGMLSQDFGKLPPVFPVPGTAFRDMFSLAEHANSPEYILAALLFTLYEQLSCNPPAGNSHVARVMDYIRANYMRHILIGQLADQINLDRRYLSRIFKEQTGVSIQEYLVRTRLEKGSQYLLRGCSVHDAASLCGYEDAANFSRMFTQYYGCSPAKWKKHAGT